MRGDLDRMIQGLADFLLGIGRLHPSEVSGTWDRFSGGCISDLDSEMRRTGQYTYYVLQKIQTLLVCELDIIERKAYELLHSQ